MDRQLVNILLMSIAFLTLFIAVQTTSQLAQSVLEGFKNETGNGTRFQGSGYTSTAMLYSCFTLVNIFAPAAVTILGSAVCMFFGAFICFLYVLSFIYPMTWSYYFISILMGFSAAATWTSQGVYLAINSNEATISRNTGIFWAFYQTSLLPGSIYVYQVLKTEIIDRSTRYSLFVILSAVAAVGLFFFLVIVFRSCMERKQDQLLRTDEEKKSALADIVATLKIAGRLIKTRHIILLLVLFVYIGSSSIFLVSVYGTSIGHYKKYGDTRKRLLGLHGILIGLGEIVGGGLFGFITKPRTASHRALIVMIGFVLQIIFYYSALVNLPSNAATNETDLKPYIDFSLTTSQVVVFTGSIFAGLGDSALNTQLMNLLGSRYKDCVASVYAIFRLFQALGAAASAFYAGAIEIQWQALILVILLFFGTLNFFWVLFDEPLNLADNSASVKKVNNEEEQVKSSSI